VSGYPVVLAGERLTALVVGGGAVATRKAGALLRAGARVRVVAQRVDPELRALGSEHASLEIAERAFATADLDDAMLVVAATDDRASNARIAREAQARRQLVNVADAPDEGSFVTPAQHRSGELLIGVTTGGVPRAAARIRDRIAGRFDRRYADALEALGALRSRLLRDGERATWRRASAELIGEDFCDAAEEGTLVRRVRAWR
jgi:siroheme synthase-like protein